MGEAFERGLNVIYDILYVIRHRGMSKRIQSGEAIDSGLIFSEVKKLLKLPGLTREEFRAVKEYYYPYKVSTLNHRDMKQLTGSFSVCCIPSELYYAYIDPYFNDKKKSLGLENKCLYPRLFPGITQPDIIAYRMNGVWLDSEYRMLSFESVVDAVDRENELFIKKADDSFGGLGVRHFLVSRGVSLGEQLRKTIEGKHGDIIIERALRQHRDIARINPHSVNTLRIYSLLMDGEVRIVAGLLRFASDEKDVDNFSCGGMMCSVDGSGQLSAEAFSHDGKRTRVHPLTNVSFAEVRIPSYDRALELVKKAHPMLPFFRFVGWDVAIREDGEPVLIEANLSTPGLPVLQLAVNPIFGEDTRKIIDEVLKGTDFPKYRVKNR